VRIAISVVWNYSIEIEFDSTINLNYLDLFLILKSYGWSSLFPVLSFSFGKKKENGLIIFEKERVSRIKKISFSDFENWINWRIQTDKKYEVNSKFYNILISFDKSLWQSINKNNELIIPVYPWEEKWMEFLKIDENRIEYLENLIKLYKKKIEFYETRKK